MNDCYYCKEKTKEQQVCNRKLTIMEVVKDIKRSVQVRNVFSWNPRQSVISAFFEYFRYWQSNKHILNFYLSLPKYNDTTRTKSRRLLNP